MEQTVYKSKKTGKCYGLAIIDGQEQINTVQPLTVDLKKYKRTGDNNNFEFYELKKK